MDILEDMQQEQQHEQEPQKQQEKEYLLPDGFGMSLDEVRALILNKYDIKVDKDDPILLIVPILNACLHEQKKLQDEYKEGLENVYQSVLNNFLENLDKRLQSGDLKVVTSQNNFLDNVCKFFSKTFFIQLLLAVVFLQAFLMIFFFGK